MIKSCKFVVKQTSPPIIHIMITHLNHVLSGSLKTYLEDFILKNIVLLSLLTAFLTACGTSASPNISSAIPPMAGSWKHLGATNNGNILVSYDTASIRKNGDFTLLRDRKIVINPALEKFTNTPHYKIAVNDWEFHCRNRSYRLAATQFLDEKGKIVSAQRFTPVQIRPMPISSGTIAQKQFELVCR